MRLALACLVAACSTGALARTGYRPFIFGGGEVAVNAAGRALRDWRGDPADSHVLLVHDPYGQWYRVRVAGGPACAFEAGPAAISAYGMDPSGLFGPGMWVRKSTFPYKRCSVRSTRLTAVPADQQGVSYADEYRLAPMQVVARCWKRGCS